MGVKISVIVPVYNVEKYLQYCLDSLKNQSKDSFEIICVNDGSRDNSLRILNENKSLKNYKVINQKNKGLSESRNVGLREAKGEYVLFLDSDDLLDESSIEKLIDLINKYRPEIIAFDAIVINEAGEETDGNKFSRKDIYKKEYLSIKEYIDGTKRKCMMNSTMHCYNREFLIKNDLYFKKDILHEDEEFTMKTLKHVKTVGYVNSGLYLRRVRGNSIMTGNLYKNKKSLESYLYVLKFFNQLKQENISNEYRELIDSRSTLLLSNLIRYEGVKHSDLNRISEELDIKVNWKRVIANVALFKVVKKGINK